MGFGGARERAAAIGSWIRATLAQGWKHLRSLWPAVKLVARGFRGENIALRASALTYISLLSFVPALAVVFAVVSAFGQAALQDRLDAFILANLAPSIGDQIKEHIDTFIARARAGTVGTIGAALLIATSVSLLRNVEESFNAIWGVTKQRPILLRAIVYWTILTLGPLALLVSMTLVSGVGPVASKVGIPPGLLAFVPVVTTVILWTLLYRLTPNARVAFWPAFWAAAVAGGAWELAKVGYIYYVAHNISYTRVYGALGAIPLFLLWIYVSWYLVLFGARLAYALQRADRRNGGARIEDPREREILCARVASSAAAAFLSGEPPPGPRALAERLGVEPAFVARATERLKASALVAEVGGEGGGLVPARAPERISLLDISHAARNHRPVERWRDAASSAVGALFARADEAASRALADTPLARVEEVTAAGRSED